MAASIDDRILVLAAETRKISFAYAVEACHARVASNTAKREVKIDLRNAEKQPEENQEVTIKLGDTDNE